MWQGSLEVNPSVLIGSFLVGISPYGPFPWRLCIFLFAKGGKFKTSIARVTYNNILTDLAIVGPRSCSAHVHYHLARY